MRDLQVIPLPPGVRVERGLLVLPTGEEWPDSIGARRELAIRYEDGFGYSGYNGTVEFEYSEDDVVITERYGYPSDDYSEESMP